MYYRSFQRLALKNGFRPTQEKQNVSVIEISDELKYELPDGNYVSHCGLWHNPGENYSYVEPVATDLEYRKIGLGKAAVYESILRAMKLGAKEAYVVTSKQFYYNIGYTPLTTETW